MDNLRILQEAMGIMQHHDAVSGTSKPYVADNYIALLFQGYKSCSINIRESLNKLSRRNDTTNTLEFESCQLLNISSCWITEDSDIFSVTIYNPLSFEVDYNIRFPVGDSNYIVLDQYSKIVFSIYTDLLSSISTLSFSPNILS